MTTDGQHGPDVDVVLVGAGMAGLYLLHRLRKQGFSTRVFETTFIITAIFFTPGFARISLVSAATFPTLGFPPISQ